MKIVTRLVYWTWCLPQTILGALFFVVLRTLDKEIRLSKYEQYTVVAESRYVLGGVSLGMYILIRSIGLSTKERERLLRHELGHIRQSLLLGPLYLILIGIPSIIWVSAKKLGLFPKIPYSWLYSEKWADTLGAEDKWMGFRRMAN